MSLSQKKLQEFIERAGKATYAGDGKLEKVPQRPGFTELVYKEEEFSYRDSYTGYIRSWGEEVVRFKNKPVWTSLYGGGMSKGKEKLADVTFEFLKKAMRVKEKGFFSVRGPHLLEDGDWKHTYQQKGDFDNFSGYQEIFYKGELVFFHYVIGGLVLDKSSLT